MMNWTGKKARTLRPDQAEARVYAVEQLASEHDVKKQKRVEALQRSFTDFCEQVFGFTPYSYQLAILQPIT